MNILDSFTKKKYKKIIARGESGKGGKTGGRGHKGQKSRSGFNLPNGFEGGQSTITTRTTKLRGGLRKKNIYLILDYAKISEKLKDSKTISKELLLKNEIINIKDSKKIIKISQIPTNIKKDFKFIDIKVTRE